MYHILGVGSIIIKIKKNIINKLSLISHSKYLTRKSQGPNE